MTGTLGGKLGKAVTPYTATRRDRSYREPRDAVANCTLMRRGGSATPRTLVSAFLTMGVAGYGLQEGLQGRCYPGGVDRTRSAF